jgi:hypothetical protein
MFIEEITGIERWDYRVVHSINEEDEVVYGIHEVYYDKDDKLLTYTGHPVTPCGTTINELMRELTLFNQAVLKPTLDKKELDATISVVDK